MNGVTPRGRAAYLSESDALVVADTHVGRDEASAVSFPLGERADLAERLDALVAHFDPHEVVVAGDVVHTFESVSARSREGLDDLQSVCANRDADLVLVVGNHDTALTGVWDGPLHDEYVLDSPSGERDPPRTVVCHGHETPDTAADRYLLGHLHPAIEVEGNRHPCFLHGEDVYRDADVLVLPAFNRLASGVLVNDGARSGVDSPLVPDLDRFRPLVYDEDTQETLRFPPLGELRRFL